MTTPEKLLMIANALRAVRGSWSANEVLQTARSWGLSVRRSDGLKALESGPADRREKGVRSVPGSNGSALVAIANNAKEPINKEREPFEAHEFRRSKNHLDGSEPINKEREPFEGFFSTQFSTGSDANNGASAISPCTPSELDQRTGSSSSETTSRTSYPFGILGQNQRVRARKKAKNRKEPAWFCALRDAVKTLQSRTLASLMPAEREILARYHAYRFGNCVRTERGNHLRGSEVAVSLTALAMDSRFGIITVRQYVALGDAVLAKRNGAPFYSAWMVIGSAELERAHCRLGPMWARVDRGESLQLVLEMVTL